MGTSQKLLFTVLKLLSILEMAERTNIDMCVSLDLT